MIPNPPPPVASTPPPVTTPGLVTTTTKVPLTKPMTTAQSSSATLEASISNG